MDQELVFPKDFLMLWKQVNTNTMTSIERGFALWSAVHTVVNQNIPGSIVECGVWKGGSAQLIALTLLQMQSTNRELFLFDTYSGMTEAGHADVDLYGDTAEMLMRGSKGESLAQLVKAEASLENVHEVIAQTGYDMRLVRFIKGDVRHTLKNTQTLNIALLRLDTDFYDSTMAELIELYPRLSRGGIMIIDDYGHWLGAKKAVEDFFAKPDVPYSRPMLWMIDYTGRGAIKLEECTNVDIERYDFLPPNLITTPKLLPLFPNAKIGNPWAVNWPYLRKAVPHIWRYDDRHTGWVTGYASVEEAACLYKLASQFAGKRGLEIGTHYGWTAAHLLSAGLKLDCVDPAMQDIERKQSISHVLDQVLTHNNSYQLWDGFSPQCIKDVFYATQETWSFVFIDGNHDGDAPRMDAEAVLPFLAADAMVVFHDLISPDVAAGLDFFKSVGFQTKLINTMQIMGVAWRGSAMPFEHIQDSNITNWLPSHLVKYID